MSQRCCLAASTDSPPVSVRRGPRCNLGFFPPERRVTSPAAALADPTPEQPDPAPPRGWLPRKPCCGPRPASLLTCSPPVRSSLHAYRPLQWPAPSGGQALRDRNSLGRGCRPYGAEPPEPRFPQWLRGPFAPSTPPGTSASTRLRCELPLKIVGRSVARPPRAPEFHQAAMATGSMPLSFTAFVLSAITSPLGPRPASLRAVDPVSAPSTALVGVCFNACLIPLLR